MLGNRSRDAATAMKPQGLDRELCDFCRAFDNEVSAAAATTRALYEKLEFREALKVKLLLIVTHSGIQWCDDKAKHCHLSCAR